MLLTGNFFKIKKIDINCDDKEISLNIKNATNKYINKYFIFLNENKMQDTIIYSNENIKKVHITNKHNGIIEVNVVKAEPIAYSKINDQHYIINDIGNISLCNKEDLPLDSVKCINFPSKNILEKFAKQYYKVRSIVRNDISDIEYISDKFDSILVRFYLINKNIIQIRVDDMVSQLEKDTFPYEAYMKLYEQNYVFSFEGKHVYIDKIK